MTEADARRTGDDHGCLVVVALRDGQLMIHSLINILDEVDVAVVDERVAGVALTGFR